MFSTFDKSFESATLNSAIICTQFKIIIRKTDMCKNSPACFFLAFISIENKNEAQQKNKMQNSF